MRKLPALVLVVLILFSACRRDDSDQIGVPVAEIDSAVDLYNMRFDLEGSYTLTADIDLSASSHTVDWTPIGDLDNPFTGSFDGNGHVISNLTIDDTDEETGWREGLFGLVDYGSLENVVLEDVDITGYGEVGGLVGTIRYGSVSDCSVSGVVESESQSVGGLVGVITGRSGLTVELTNCHSSATVIGGGDFYTGGLAGSTRYTDVTGCSATGTVTSQGDQTGGLIGWVNGGVLSDCWSSGDVTGVDNTGGLLGSGSADVENCYAINGTVSGSSGTGGLIGSSNTSAVISDSRASVDVVGTDWNTGGFCGYMNGDSISRCYSTGTVHGERNTGGFAGYVHSADIDDCFTLSPVDGDNYVGGLVGNSYGSEFINCYAAALFTSDSSSHIGGILGYGSGTINAGTCRYDFELSLCADNGAGRPLTTAQMTDGDNVATNYTGWDFADVWTIAAGVNGGYPGLRDNPPIP